jgi:hypothetical protein
LAGIPSKFPDARDWALDLVAGVLESLANDEDVAREAAPGAAVFYASFGMDDQVRLWLDRGTHQHSPDWRDGVLVSLLQWSVGAGDLAGARQWLSQVETPRMRDGAHACLARALAMGSPETAVLEHLEAITDQIRKAALAAELAVVPEVSGSVVGLYSLLLALQDSPETLAKLLSQLVEDHPGHPLVQDIAKVFGDNPEPAGSPDYHFAPMCTQPSVLEFFGRRSRPQLESLQGRLEAEAEANRPQYLMKFAQLLVSEGILEVGEIQEFVDMLGGSNK